MRQYQASEPCGAKLTPTSEEMTMRNEAHTDTLALTLRLRGGEVVTVRTMRPGDGERLQTYIRGLSRESRHNRFLGALNELSPMELTRLGCSDHEHHAALIVESLHEGSCQIVAEARYAMMRERSTCEVALSVTDGWQRRGLGTVLIEILTAHARRLGAHIMVADALRTNEAIKGLARKTDLAIRPDVGDARLIRLVKTIAPQTTRFAAA
jgi:acetyltransferase